MSVTQEFNELTSKMNPNVLALCLAQTKFALDVQTAAQKENKDDQKSNTKKERDRKND